MLRRFFAAIGRVLDTAIAFALVPVKSFIETLYPGIFDLPPAPVHEIEQALDWDPFEHAAERQADREEALADTLTYAAETLTAGQPAEMPVSLRPFAAWLRGLNDCELERLLTADPTHVYAHLHLDMPMPELPSLDEVRPAPCREAPADALRRDVISEPRGLPAAVF
jgi:hypothetical protein